jgi:hypothetical protein
MNYCETEQECAEYYAQVAIDRKFSPCDPYAGAYMLLDEASPDEPPKYFTSLEGAVHWASTDNQYISYQGVEQWSVYRVGNKIL